jgi:DNA processing protein
MEREELAAWLRLQLTPGVGNGAARKLLAAFGLPQQIFDQSAAALGQVVSDTQRTALQSQPPQWPALLDTTWDWLQAEPTSRRVLALGDDCYPASLLNMEDPPLLLYAMGTPQAWLPGGLAHSTPRSVAIVGSRNPTAQGTLNARHFAHALAQSGLTVVSGLALGVDGAAHEGALDGAPPNQLATIAVVGTGLDRVYPRQHRELAHRIAQRGVLISEYPLGTPPLSANFPRRNRIIAGLSQATLVVEAALQSGSLITARLALEQGKDVFAIPGSIHATQAKGCHALIKQGAKLVESAQDILEEWLPGNFSVHTNSGTVALSDAEPMPADDTPAGSLLAAMGFDPIGLDALLARTGLPIANLQAQLMALEIDGQVARLPGGLFQRLARA